MPFVTTEATKTVAEHIKWRRPRNQFSHHHHHPISETDPNPPIPHPIIQSTRCKSTISSLLLSNETSTINDNVRSRKKSNFSAASFRGFGCTAGASQQVSVPAVIRASADWQGKKARKKKHKSNKNSSSSKACHGGVIDGSATCVDFQDVWCGPGIGFSADAAASVDYVVSRKNVSARGKIDVDKITHSHRERRSSSLGRGTVSFLDTDPDLPEMIMLQGSILMGGRLNSHDHFREWRLDVDNMSYEQLLELGERIGYVNTGLKEDEMGCNIRKTKLQVLNDASKNQVDKKCSICQEEYEADDVLGTLNCEHSYHFHCIQQWVAQKNFCPVCKKQVAARH